MKCIICLGNPGSEYERTRHNIGFRIADVFINANNLLLWKKKFKSIIFKGIVEGETVLVVKPQTYMNLSGEAVGLIVNFFKISLENLFVVYDDFELDFGIFRVRKKGGAGTHNGLRSIVSVLKSTDFPRFRVGIGPITEKMQIKDFVLQNFSSKEEENMVEVLDKSIDCITVFLNSDISKVMNVFNKNVLD